MWAMLLLHCLIIVFTLQFSPTSLLIVKYVPLDPKDADPHEVVMDSLYTWLNSMFQVVIMKGKQGPTDSELLDETIAIRSCCGGDNWTKFSNFGTPSCCEDCYWHFT